MIVIFIDSKGRSLRKPRLIKKLLDERNSFLLMLVWWLFIDQ